MIKAFKEFWSSYFDLCKESGKWLKKHWIGYIILCIVVFFVTLASFWIPGKIEERKRRKEAIKSLEEELEE